MPRRESLLQREIRLSRELRFLPRLVRYEYRVVQEQVEAKSPLTVTYTSGPLRGQVHPFRPNHRTYYVAEVWDMFAGKVNMRSDRKGNELQAHTWGQSACNAMNKSHQSELATALGVIPATKQQKQLFQAGASVP